MNVYDQIKNVWLSVIVDLFFCLGSKKSAPIRLVKEACEAVEILDGIPIRNSSLNASVNMESLCHHLEQQPNLLQVCPKTVFE